jgi:hypothetical protein
MGLMTFTEFQTALKFRHQNNDNFVNQYPLWINRGYKQLATMDRIWSLRRSVYFPELQTSADVTSVASTATIAKPTDCLTVGEIYDATNNNHLGWLSWNSYVGMTDRYTAIGKPGLWHRKGDLIYLHPTPDGAYTIRVYYRKFPPALSGASDTTAIGKPGLWHRKGDLIYLHPTPDGAYTIRVYYRKFPPALSGASDTTAIGAEWDDIILDLADYHSRKDTNEYDKATTLLGSSMARIGDLVTVFDEEEKARRERMSPDIQGIWGTY